MKTDKLKAIFTNKAVIILLIIILLGVVAINPQPWAKGAAIRSVEINSSAYNAGIANPKATAAPTSRERITSLNSMPIASALDFYSAASQVPEGATLTLTTNKKSYLLTKGSSDTLGLSVYDAPKSNLRMGLDLVGGTRVLLQPDEAVTPDQMAQLISNLNKRLNVYGLSDLTIRSSTNLLGNQFIAVEIAGANEKEVRELLSRQGKFEAKVGNTSVFMGNDISYVCNMADCQRIESTYKVSDQQYVSTFRFSVSLTEEAANRMANATSRLSVDPASTSSNPYLNESIDLFLDDTLVDSLRISSELKGKVETEISITGSGEGRTAQESQDSANQDMKNLQTILRTGSLPVKINIVKTDSISPALGKEFTRNAMMVGLISLLSVSLVVFLKYRKLAIVLPMLIIGWLEIFLTLAYASLIGWNLDVSSIAGIMIAIGTGINDQIIITDETLRGGKAKEENYNWKKRIKAAFSIVLASFFTSVASLGPLFFAGAGMLKGFAITSLIGLALGVIFTRPAFANIIEIILKD